MDDFQNMLYAKNYAKNSRCEKRPLGCALILQDGTIIGGTNGPPYPLTKCNPCPRTNVASATKLEMCKAVHAERQTLLKCAFYGLNARKSTLYLYTGVPCKDCLLELIQAGVKEIVCQNDTFYDELSKDILSEWIEKGGIFRTYKLEVKVKNE